MAQANQESKLKEMAEQFSNLAMRNPGKMVTSDGVEIDVSHPYQFILGNFPSFESFQDYFSELALEYRTMGSYEEFLRGLYRNIMALQGVVNGMAEGIEPQKMNLMLRSFQMFMKMSQRKYQLSNTRMVRVHTAD